ncbi:MAG: T9SS type A sorting domain-containing protein [Bacteroidota bacterium]
MATFRKLTLFGSFWLFTSLLLSQSPDGDIFGINRHGTEAGLFAINYPSETYLAIDSAAPQDLCLNSENLFMNVNFSGTANDFIFQYRLSDFQKTDSLALSCYRIANWQDNILALCDSMPFVRVFNPLQGWSNILQLDSTKVPNRPLEVITADDKAYLLYPQSLQVISLSQGDTLGTYPTPHPFPAVGYNTSISQDTENLYVGVAYATGAIRSSLLKVAKADMVVETAYHKEFRDFFSPPVPYRDKVFVYTYSDHYSISQDSLFEFVHVLTETVLTADTSSEQIFIWDLLNQRLSLEYQGQRSNGIGLLQKPDKALWRAESQGVAIAPDLSLQFAVYPNPSEELLQIDLPISTGKLHLTLLDFSGRLLAEREVVNQQRISWELAPNYPAQFILSIRTEDGCSASRIIQKRGY